MTEEWRPMTREERGIPEPQPPGPATVGEALADMAKMLDRQVKRSEDGEVASVGMAVNHGELAVLSLGLSETSTKAQREHAREVVSGWVHRAFDAIADSLAGGQADVRDV